MELIAIGSVVLWFCGLWYGQHLSSLVDRSFRVLALSIERRTHKKTKNKSKMEMQHNDDVHHRGGGAGDYEEEREEVVVSDPSSGMSECVLQEKEIKKHLLQTKAFIEKHRELIGEEEAQRELTKIEAIQRELDEVNKMFMDNFQKMCVRGDLIKEVLPRTQELAMGAKKLKEQSQKKSSSSGDLCNVS